LWANLGHPVIQTHCHNLLFAVFLTLTLFNCNHEDKPLLEISLNGSLLTSGGIAPIKTFEAEFKGFLKRQALQLKPGNIVTYVLPASDLQNGTIEFWMKINSSPPHFPIRFIHLQNGANSSVEFFLQQKAIALSLKREGKIEKWRSLNYFQGKAKWLMVDLTWDLTKRNPFEIYLDGEPLEIEPLQGQDAHSRNSSDKSQRLTIGIPKVEDDSEELTVDLRDLVLRNNARSARTIKASFTVGQELMKKSLVWPAADLRHYAGKQLRDTEATNGICWTVDTIIGKKEGIRLPAKGEYELSFRIKPFTRIEKDNFRCEVFSTDSSGSKTRLAEWKNSQADFSQLDTFQSNSIRFTSLTENPISFQFQSFIPSKGSMLLDTISIRSLTNKWQKQWRFEDLEHTMGVWKEDPEASNGKGWINAHTLDYGPYTCIGQPGKYRATWRIRVAPDISPQTPLVLLDVYAHDGYLGQRKGNKSYAKFQLNASQFQKRGAWEDKSIEFNYDGADMMEFRAFARTLQSPSFAIDTVTVTRVN
jgi:hypothetical protein